LSWLSRRELTEQQIRQRLARRGTDPDTIEHTAERLRGVRAIDDARVAAAYARTASAIKGRGRNRIARELAQMGIEHDAARDALDAVVSPDVEQERLDKALARKVRGVDLDDRSQRQKVVAGLMRQGFDLDAIRLALRRLAASGTDDD